MIIWVGWPEKQTQSSSRLCIIFIWVLNREFSVSGAQNELCSNLWKCLLSVHICKLGQLSEVVVEVNWHRSSEDRLVTNFPDLLGMPTPISRKVYATQVLRSPISDSAASLVGSPSALDFPAVVLPVFTHFQRHHISGVLHLLITLL